MPKIFVLSRPQNSPIMAAMGYGDSCYARALAEDGTVIGGWVTSPDMIEWNMGPQSKGKYEAHYPDGYELVFVDQQDEPTTPGLAEALERCPDLEFSMARHVTIDPPFTGVVAILGDTTIAAETKAPHVQR